MPFFSPQAQTPTQKEKHKAAADMVANVPTNIYIEDWKREAQKMARYVLRLQDTIRRLDEEQGAKCREYDKLAQIKE